jgi:hypothetical protein
MLDLGHNELTLLPESLGDLTGLSDFLYLHDNRLLSLPHSMERMKKLRYLNISENAFSTFLSRSVVCGVWSSFGLRTTSRPYRMASRICLDYANFTFEITI